MESKSIIVEETLFSYKQVAYHLGIEPSQVWNYLKQKGVLVSPYMLFSKEHLLRLGLYKEEKTEIYYIYESKINYLKTL